MNIFRTMTASLLAALSFMLVFGLTAAPAQAQATRTWVSGVGDDVNPCSRTAPCKTFAGAISKTATNGEINCLDPGGFGGVTITKSISIICDYTEGGVLTAGAGVNGVVINAPASAIVFLSGLDFNGAGSAQNGVRIIAAATVTIRNSLIRNFQASNGLGVSFQPSGDTELNIFNTTISDNGTGSTGGGILVQPTGAGGKGRLVLKDVRITNNALNGLFINTTGNTNATGINVLIEDSLFVHNGTGIAITTPVGNNTVGMMMVGSTISENANRGLTVNGPSNTVRVADTTVSSNFTGLEVIGGSLLQSYGTNRVFLNGVNGAFSGAIIPQD